MVPSGEDELADARVGLAFQAHAATDRESAAGLARQNAALRGHLAELLRAAGTAGDVESSATALLATAEGLGIHVLAADLDGEAARAALAAHVDLVLASR
ncbi:TetR family transcriptional regulator C-terminal domain-containing protein [Microbacterium sp. 179-B 1A2 NHS]|uniref:TetR family transcriptional regulator C-terminal domain-containing protein n=1 Tax=Microbacterium sp. 179-B 1A2 NHS TaxID=3142383 RepID=UPI0039A13CD9